MKNNLKKPKEIELMLEGGQKLGKIRDELEKFAQVGVNLLEIEKLAQELIAKAGGKPNFAMVPGYHWATCINLNEGIVHGIPYDRQIKHGDLVSIDVGLFYKGFHTDTCTSFLVKQPDKDLPYEKEITDFLNIGKKALEEAIKIAQPGNRISDISRTIQEIVEGGGYSCSWELTGHGVGYSLHEYPQIPCVLEVDPKQTPIIKPGMTLAIEVIYAMGNAGTITSLGDNWTMSTKDKSLSAVIEKTIAINSDSNIIITP